MSPALAALLRAVANAARAGTLMQSVTDGLALATWALQHPDLFGAAVDLIRGTTGGTFPGALLDGGAAAVESPAMEHADGSHMGGA